ncbi:hypothetical protein BY458DRAFT_529829 [Sporodiniella umbellata]|nr:hypothetical protein BY458DRAFT_529829 [Sporodiniella umbellata]
MYSHFVFLFTLFYLCAAQLGAQIFKPHANDSISPGEKIDTEYQYDNVGPGEYTLSVNLWRDNAATDLAYAIAKDISIPSGNSTGTHLDFHLNSTYTWTVPRDLNDTVYLTVHTRVASKTNYTLRSAPVMLHVSSAFAVLPFKALLFSLVLASLAFTF